MTRSRTLEQLADEELMLLVQRGEADAFEVIFDRHGGAAFSLAYRMVGNRSAAEDVVQESFLSEEDEGARTLAATVDRSRGPDASASLIVPEDGEVAILSVQGLRQTAGEQVYVVWAQRGTELIFESSFNVRPDGSGKAAIEGIVDLDRVMVTRERSSGVAAPGEDPILTVDTS